MFDLSSPVIGTSVPMLIFRQCQNLGRNGMLSIVVCNFWFAVSGLCALVIFYLCNLRIMVLFPAISVHRHASSASTLIYPQITQIDRKSTRLNSSHLGISYAVFCLKKK